MGAALLIEQGPISSNRNWIHAMSKDHGPKPDNVAVYQRRSLPSDENFENLVSNWRRLNSRLTVFLGAGASVGAKNRTDQFLPSALRLRDELWADFMCSEEEKKA